MAKKKKMPWEDVVEPPKKKIPRKEQAEARAMGNSERKAAARSELRDCGEIPAPENPDRREKCRLDLPLFLMTYFPLVYRHPFSLDHLRVLAKHQTAVLEGGRFIEAVYRGFGKTSMEEGTGIWAVLYGHRRFVPIIGADHASAEMILESIKSELLDNDLIHADFPEVGVPLKHSKGSPQKINIQTCLGEPTNGEWTADKIALPEVKRPDGSWYDSSGNVIQTASLIGRLRGMKHKARGEVVRPDFCMIDDPQTDESAASPAQVEKRLMVLKKTIFGLSGHDVTMSVIITATVICKDDFVDQLLDHSKNPSWATERIKMLRKWSENHDTLWMKEYKNQRQAFDPTIEGDRERAQRDATVFYQKNRKAMDKGVEVSWEHCFDADCEVSAIQHAYNKLIDNGQEAFDSECQCEPTAAEELETQISYTDVMGKLNNRPRGQVPAAAVCLTGFIDLQEQSLFWLVAGWSQNFTGWVIDYGVFPRQNQTYFRICDMKQTLAREYPGRGQEGLWRAGLEETARMLVRRKWPREDGNSSAQLDKLFLDANQGQASETVRTFIAESDYGSTVLPYISRGVGASEKPFNEYHKKPGDRVGLNWRVPVGVGRNVRHILVDVNFWKTFVKHRWKTAAGDVGALSLFGGEPDEHRLFVDHMLCETGVPVEGRGRKLEEWRMRRGNFTENHWFDGIVGAAVGASTMGCVLGGENGALHGGKARGGYRVVDRAELSRMGGRR